MTSNQHTSPVEESLVTSNQPSRGILSSRAGTRSIDAVLAELAGLRQRYEHIRRRPELMEERAQLISQLHTLRAEAAAARQLVHKEELMHPYATDMIVRTVIEDRMREAERYRLEHPRSQPMDAAHRVATRLLPSIRPRDTRPTNIRPADSRPTDRRNPSKSYIGRP